MQTLKTLNQAIKLNEGQLTVENILNGNIYTSKGWTKFKVSDELLEDTAEQVSEILGGRHNTRKQVFNSLRFGSVSHWGLRRILIDKRKNASDKRRYNIYLSYCAGQDYTSELRSIRTELR